MSDAALAERIVGLLAEAEASRVRFREIADMAVQGDAQALGTLRSAAEVYLAASKDIAARIIAAQPSGLISPAPT